MGFLMAIIVGFVVGSLGKLLMPGRDPGGVVITILLGISGAVVAQFFGQQMGYYGPNEAAGMIASILGAMFLLAIYRVLVGRGSGSNLPS